MNKNVEEYKKQVEDLKKQINSNISKMSLNEVRQTQFDKLTSEHRNLVITASKSETEKARLQSKLQEISKELEELKKTIVPDDVIQQLKHDNQFLNQSLDEKEEYLKKSRKHLEDALKHQRQAEKAYHDLKANFDAKFKKLTDQSERKLKALRHKLQQTLRPGDIKALAIVLKRVGSLDFKNADYEKTRKEIIAARDRYEKLSKDPKTPRE